jgi:hypothetical protein
VRPSIDLLRRVVGLTPSGAVRLVDRLEEEGLVSRGGGADGRSTLVTLTTRGRRAAEGVAGARGAVLTASLDALSSEERRTLEVLLSRLLVGFVLVPGRFAGCAGCATRVRADARRVGVPLPTRREPGTGSEER